MIKRNLLLLVFRVEPFSEDGGSRFLENVGTYLPNYMASHPRTT
jgi:hypothetical protein